MKRRVLALICATIMAVGTLAGCGNAQEQNNESGQALTVEEITTEAANEDASASEDKAEQTETEEQATGLANPWVTTTEEDANANCYRLFKAPEGATNVEWMKCEALGDEEKGIGPLLQLSFNLDGVEFTARAQYGAAEDTDIAGNFVEWTVGPEDTTLANWGEGHMQGKLYRSINESGYLDMITWYDIEIGISYSLTAAAADLEGFDIQAVAEQMYQEMTEEW